MSLYSVLGIPRDADEQMIRSAYRILARRYHPDRGAGSSSEKFRQIAEAYQTLIDPASRLAYDRSLRPAEPAPRPSGHLRQEDPRVFGHFNDFVDSEWRW